MEDVKKQDYAAKVNSIADDFLGFVSAETSPCFCEYCANEVQETVKNLLDFRKPKIMVYGIYNSGKSTLINALLKEEKAEMADKPQTDCITEYDHGDYILVDSPGVDAPIQHEQITDSFINKCHIILFVISSKGGFESETNYRKMVELIKKDIPFIIVLNDRGYAADARLSKEERERKKTQHNQELNDIQHKIIENLRKVSGDNNIADQYETIVLNAKKALTGLQKNNHLLYENSRVDFLNQRIVQMIQNSGSIGRVMKQPIANLKVCFDQTEMEITKEMSGGTVDYSDRIDVLRKQKSNLMEELRIYIRSAVSSRIDDIASLYLADNADAAESVIDELFESATRYYEAKLTETFSALSRKVNGIDGIENYLDKTSNLDFSDVRMRHSYHYSEAQMENDEEFMNLPPQKKSIFDFLKSRKRREEDRRKRLQQEADLINQRNQNRVNAQIRQRQEARQAASSDMIELQAKIISAVSCDMNAKFEELIQFIEQLNAQNQEMYDIGNRKLQELAGFRSRIESIENILRFD
jgi:GTP-binding protein EngB required for normal cell division